MAWIKLTDFDERKPVWINLRTHDFMTRNPDHTRLSVYDGGHTEVVETPEQILELLLHAMHDARRAVVD